MGTQKPLSPHHVNIQQNYRSPDLTSTGILTEKKTTMPCISLLPVHWEFEGAMDVIAAIISSVDNPERGQKYQDLKIQIIKYIIFT